MSDSVQLAAEQREATGKKVRQLREQGFVPGTVHERGKDSLNVQVEYNLFVKAYAQAGQAQPIDLQVGKKKLLTMVKDVTVDPARNTFTHITFHAVNANETVEAEVPVKLDSEDIPAEQAGNFLVWPNATVTIKAVPAKLPEELTLPADKLSEPSDSLNAGDIVMPADIELVTDPETTLVIVEEPKEEPEQTEEVVDAADVPADNGGDQATSDEEKSE